MEQGNSETFRNGFEGLVEGGEAPGNVYDDSNEPAEDAEDMEGVIRAPGNTGSVSGQDASEREDIASKNRELVESIPVRLVARLGKTKMLLGKVLNLTTGSVIQLDTLYGDDVELIAGDRRLGRGQIVVVRDRFGVKITDIDI